jgi:hypothetical protein
MATKYTKRPLKRPNGHIIYQHIPLQDPPKIYPKWDFWSENMYTLWQTCFSSVRCRQKKVKGIVLSSFFQSAFRFQHREVTSDPENTRQIPCMYVGMLGEWSLCNQRKEEKWLHNPLVPWTKTLTKSCFVARYFDKNFGQCFGWKVVNLAKHWVKSFDNWSEQMKKV